MTCVQCGASGVISLRGELSSEWTCGVCGQANDIRTGKAEVIRESTTTKTRGR